MSDREGGHPHTNALIGETSPYLLQHAHNPVQWHPWNDAALARAKAEDKPIFLSIGYSACHWCHVMERESFENEAIAGVLNAHFVCVKVDREERPDIDDIYMSAVVSLTGQGGWPLSVFLTPDLKPFYGGTYYPPVDLHGRPGFPRILAGVAEAWSSRRAEVVQSAEGLTEFVARQLENFAPAGEVSDALLAGAMEHLERTFDPEHGGWGGAPKFPSSAGISLLLREYRRTGSEAALQMSVQTLDAMTRGGMYDHLGGGFHRYSVDAQWLVPHFEKMLYDNAQLAHVYLEAFQATGHARYRRTAEEIFNYVLRDMTGPGGAFHSAEDADSEGEEGKFYLWTQAEIRQLLGTDDAELFSNHYGVREEGNFTSHEPFHRGMNILHIHAAPGEELTGEQQTRLAACRAKLLDARARRVRPGLDDKVLTSWNALMISALARGAQVLDRPDYAEAAAKAGQFILREMTEDGRLLRTHRAGRSHLPAYLDDHAFLANAFVDLYEATFDRYWAEEADNLARRMMEAFWDEEHGLFCFTGSGHAHLIVRARPAFDGAEPSGNSVAALALLRLSRLLDRADYRAKAERILRANAENMRRAPHGFLKMLSAVDSLLHPPPEVVIAGNPAAADTQALVRAAHSEYTPDLTLALHDPEAPDAGAAAADIPLLRGRGLVNGKPAAYVCQNSVCGAPVTGPADLLEQLRAWAPQDTRGEV